MPSAQRLTSFIRLATMNEQSSMNLTGQKLIERTVIDKPLNLGYPAMTLKIP